MNKELLFSITKKDFIFEAIRGSGPGGQHRNKSHTGIRITHKASGASIAATDSKSQSINKRNAFSRLIKSKKFKS
jgi:protein subunit release factor B